jgi:hypothetical protein
MPWPLFTPGKDPVPIIQEAGWAAGPVWTGAKHLAPTSIRFPDRPARSQLLYQLGYLVLKVLLAYVCNEYEERELLSVSYHTVSRIILKGPFDVQFACQGSPCSALSSDNLRTYVY